VVRHTLFPELPALRCPIRWCPLSTRLYLLSTVSRLSPVLDVLRGGIYATFIGYIVFYFRALLGSFPSTKTNVVSIRLTFREQEHEKSLRNGDYRLVHVIV